MNNNTLLFLVVASFGPGTLIHSFGIWWNKLIMPQLVAHFTFRMIVESLFLIDSQAEKFHFLFLYFDL